MEVFEGDLTGDPTTLDDDDDDDDEEEEGEKKDLRTEEKAKRFWKKREMQSS